MIRMGTLRGIRGGFVRLHDKARRGVAAVEFAMVAPVFIWLLIGIMEMSLVLLAQHLIENATFNASRTAKTGYVESGKTQLETVEGVLFSKLSGLSPLIDTSKLTVDYQTYADLTAIQTTGVGTKSLGAASEIVVYTVSYPWKLFTPLMGSALGDGNGEMILTSRIVVRNEPYD